MFNTVSIIGMGLIGGSIGIDLRERGLARRVIGIARRPDVASAIVACGAADEATTDWAPLAESDLVVMAAPVSVIIAQMPEVARLAPPDAVVTDVGSTKAAIVAAGEAVLGGRFVGGHPMAGSHEGGIGAARAGLFQGATWVFTPTPRTDETALSRLNGLAKGLGAVPAILSAEEQDRIAAAVSHMPHLAAAALSLAVAGLADGDPRFAHLAGGGLRDMTRLAASPANLWRDIFATNREHTREALRALQSSLEATLAVLDDDDALESLFARAGALRQALVIAKKG